MLRFSIITLIINIFYVLNHSNQNQFIQLIHLTETLLPSTGLTPLHYATHAKYEECLELLIIRGADLNQADEIGITAMHLAAEKGYLEIMRILIKAGAKVKFNEGNVMVSGLNFKSCLN